MIINLFGPYFGRHTKKKLQGKERDPFFGHIITGFVFCDNTSGINISKNHVLHFRTKHIDIRHHFIRDLVEDKIISLEYVPTEGQIIDILTKPLDVSRFESLRRSIGLCTFI